MIRVKLRSEIPIYQQLVSEIKRLIGERHLADGDTLPPIRSLATQLDVANNTVARAYQVLESEGLIETRGRGGTIVRTRAPAASVDPEQVFSDTITRLLGQGYGRQEIEGFFSRGLQATLGKSLTRQQGGRSK